MVHALQEIRRVLVPRGYLIDLRPYLESAPVAVLLGPEVSAAGLLDTSDDHPDDLAANAAAQQAVENGWFRRGETASFWLYTYWDTMAEFQSFIDNMTNTKLPATTAAQIEKLLAAYGPQARIRTRYEMLITRYDKQPNT